VLEVISYNEAAGRFEFQLVKDYRAGGRPQVFYANRNICYACHQNGAPIFSRALWDETNANPAIAARLTARGAASTASRPGAAWMCPTPSTTRCAAPTVLRSPSACGTGEAGARCRAGLFAAAVRLRLPATGRHRLMPPSAKTWPGHYAPMQPECGRRALRSADPTCPMASPNLLWTATGRAWRRPWQGARPACRGSPGRSIVRD
jgi:hypothetical protein